MTKDTPAPAPRKDLDELIAQFEDEVRKRPTPAELAEAERTGAPVARGPRAAEPDLAPAAAAPPEPTARAEPEPKAEAEPKVEPEPRAVPTPEPELSLEAAAPQPEPGPPVAAAVLSAPTAGVEDLETWWAGGERVELELPSGAKYAIFTRVLGDGPWMTMIHGFPTSSWDWAPMAPALAKRYRLLTFDLLGFGDSDKPRGHDWNGFEQADIVEALWRHFGVEQTRVVAHDVGMTVSLELLARLGEGTLSTQIVDYTLFNGGVYTDFHRPRPMQVWLQRPLVGALLSKLLSERRFGFALAEAFSPGHQPTAEELHQQWLSVRNRGGDKTYHRLIKYMAERRANKQRWEAAVEGTSTPIRFIWGMLDPISGAHMAEVIKERRPNADFVELEDVGHFPMLEATDRAAAAIVEGPSLRRAAPANTAG